MKRLLIIVLPLFMIIIGMIFICRGTEAFSAPQRVNVYFETESKIVSMSFFDYIRGCVFGALSPSSEREALKAAASACMTKALYIRAHADKAEFCGADFSDNAEKCMPFMPSEEIRKSFSAYLIEKVTRCTEEGISLAITYNGEPIFAEMCAISAGKTDDGGFPYLTPVSCACDEESDEFFGCSAFTPEMVRQALKNAGISVTLPFDCAEWFAKPQYLESGTLSSVSFGGKVISGKALQNALSLRSAAIEIEYSEGALRFTTKGVGNNLGMSLYCANTLAKQGMKCTDILLYFYPETTLSEINIR